MRAIGTSQLLKKKYDTYDLGEVWTKHIGKPEKGGCINISGYSANGKTNFTIMLVKAFAEAGVKVDYNSFEEGHESTMQEVAIRHNLQDVSGKIIWLDRYTYKELDERLSKKYSAKVVVIDSGDDMNFTYAQFLKFKEKFPKKTFIVVSKGNEKTGNPIWKQQEKIKFKCPVKIIVKNFVAYMDSRYGGNEKVIIRDKQDSAGDQLTLI